MMIYFVNTLKAYCCGICKLFDCQNCPKKLKDTDKKLPAAVTKNQMLHLWTKKKIRLQSLLENIFKIKLQGNAVLQIPNLEY